MNNKIILAIKHVLALSAAGSVMMSATAATIKSTTAAKNQQEKCYGIVKAGLNDCQTANQSCAGSAVKDNQGDAFLFLPKGLCEKIVNGSLKAKTDSKK